MDVVTVRRIGADDWRMLRALRLEALEESPAAFASSAESERSKPEGMWRARVDTTAIAFRDDRPLGLAGWVWREPVTTAELVGMWVRSDERGSGTADLLVEFVRDTVFQQGYRLELEVHPDNLRAIRFYERCGLEVVGQGVGAVTGRVLTRMRLTRGPGGGTA